MNIQLKEGDAELQKAHNFLHNKGVKSNKDVIPVPTIKEWLMEFAAKQKADAAPDEWVWNDELAVCFAEMHRFSSGRTSVKQFKTMIGTGWHKALQKTAKELLTDWEQRAAPDGWIRVEDRLPEIPPKFYDEDWKLMVEPLMVYVIVCEGEYVHQCSYSRISGFDSTTDIPVTHWQPLPPPPKTIRQ